MSKSSDYMGLVSAIDFIESLTGRRPTTRTLNRWMFQGLGGVKLRSVKFGGSRLTKREWLLEFFESTNASPGGR